MIKEMAIDLWWLALLFVAIGFNLVIVTTVGLILKTIVEKFKEGYKKGPDNNDPHKFKV